MVFINTFQSDRIKANKNDHPFLIDYQNTNDPVLFWFDPNLGLGKIKNADLTIREESNRDFCIFTLGQLALESFGKNYKRKLRPIKQSNDEEVCV